MSNTIQIKRSSTASSVPTAGQLAQGELAVNLVDKKLYTKDNTNAVVLLNPETPPFSINGLTTTTVATNDFLPFADISDSGNPKKATVQDVVALGLNATGSAPTYAARAWVNFNGTTSPGTIRASGNVSSVTRNGTGDYTINFTTAMPDANYAITGAARYPTSNNAYYVGIGTNNGTGTYTASSVQIRTLFGPNANAPGDCDIVNVSVFR
jgi:hypothetical protein